MGVTEAFAESVDKRRLESRPRGSDETGKNKNKKLHVLGDVHVGLRLHHSIGVSAQRLWVRSQPLMFLRLMFGQLVSRTVSEDGALHDAQRPSTSAQPFLFPTDHHSLQHRVVEV